MLIALLSGHYYYMLSTASKNRMNMSCDVCGVPYDSKNLLHIRNCVCSLVIPGQYPMSDKLNDENIKFLKFVDKLQYLFCFQKPWRSEGMNIIVATNCPDKFTFDKPSVKLNDLALRAWTVGS